jgi:O-antigen ligase
MVKYIALAIIISVGFFRWVIAKNSNKPAAYILISSYIQTICFGMDVKFIYDFIPPNLAASEITVGGFGRVLSIEVSFLFVLLFMIFGYTKVSKDVFTIKKNPWLFIFLLFCVIAFFNPFNTLRLAFLVPLSIVLPLVVLLSIIKINIDKAQVLRGIYNGLLISVLIQLALSICYPVLGLKFAAEMFKGEDALLSSTRRDSMSAIGTFGHPGNLALYCLLCSVFFYSCMSHGYKKRLSKLLTFSCLFVILLTFSRTTYLGAIIVFAAVYVIRNQKESIFSFKNIALSISVLGVILAILYFSPLSDLFLKSDAENQFDNRFSHFIIGYEIWSKSPWIGIGINSHVHYMTHVFNTQLLRVTPIFNFLISNPIHNIHIQILAECGLTGFIAWMYYFISRINMYSKHVNTEGAIDNIFNLSFVGILIGYFIYGFFGWSPFNKEIYVLVIFIGFFAKYNKEKSRRSLVK